ncbi:MAG: hypothetical protein K2N87_08910 [Eubacterium sp.]|nr:hypothetical protein [Eubacterium sp.]
MLKGFVRQLVQIGLAMAAIFWAGNWAVRYAYENRGYDAIGGEYLFIPVVYLGVYEGISLLLDILEEIRSNRLRKRQMEQAVQDERS